MIVGVPPSNPPVDTAEGPCDDQRRQTLLNELLASVFASVTDLRQWFETRVAHGKIIVDEIPSGAAKSQAVHMAVDALIRRNILDKPFFTALSDYSEGNFDRIAKVAKSFGAEIARPATKFPKSTVTSAEATADDVPAAPSRRRALLGPAASLTNFVLLLLVLAVVVAAGSWIYYDFRQDPGAYCPNALDERGGPRVTVVSALPVRGLAEAFADALNVRYVRAQAAKCEREDSTHPSITYIQIARPTPDRSIGCDDELFSRAYTILDQRKQATEARGDADEQELMEVDDKIVNSDIVVCLPAATNSRTVGIVVNPESDFEENDSRYLPTLLTLERPFFADDAAVAPEGEGFLGALWTRLPGMHIQAAPSLESELVDKLEAAVLHVAASRMILDLPELSAAEAEIDVEEAGEAGEAEMAEAEIDAEKSEIDAEKSEIDAEIERAALYKDGTHKVAEIQHLLKMLALKRRLSTLFARKSMHDDVFELLREQRILACRLAHATSVDSPRKVTNLWKGTYDVHGQPRREIASTPSESNCVDALTEALKKEMQATSTTAAEHCLADNAQEQFIPDVQLWTRLCLPYLLKEHSGPFAASDAADPSTLNLLARLSDSWHALSAENIGDLLRRGPHDVAVLLPLIMLRESSRPETRMRRLDIFRAVKIVAERDSERRNQEIIKSAYLLFIYYYANLGERHESLARTRSLFRANVGKISDQASLADWPGHIQQMTARLRPWIEDCGSADGRHWASLAEMEPATYDSASRAGIDLLILHTLRLYSTAWITEKRLHERSAAASQEDDQPTPEDEGNQDRVCPPSNTTLLAGLTHSQRSFPLFLASDPTCRPAAACLPTLTWDESCDIDDVIDDCIVESPEELPVPEGAEVFVPE